MKYRWVVAIFLFGLCCLGGFLVYKQVKLRPVITPPPEVTGGQDVALRPTNTLYLTPTPTSTPTDTPTPTSTPYITTFNGFFYCREKSTSSSQVIILIQGQSVTIRGRNDGWLYVSVKNSDTPCWVSKDAIPDLNESAIERVPVYSNDIVPTFTLLAGTHPAVTHENRDETPNPSVDTQKPPTSQLPADTFKPPTSEPSTSKPPTPKPPTPKPPTDTPSGPRQCNDGIDNDGDGYIDFPADSGCRNNGDDSE